MGVLFQFVTEILFQTTIQKNGNSKKCVNESAYGKND